MELSLTHKIRDIINLTSLDEFVSENSLTLLLRSKAILCEKISKMENLFKMEKKRFYVIMDLSAEYSALTEPKPTFAQYIEKERIMAASKLTCVLKTNKLSKNNIREIVLLNWGVRTELVMPLYYDVWLMYINNFIWEHKKGVRHEMFSIDFSLDQITNDAVASTLKKARIWLCYYLLFPREIANWDVCEDILSRLYHDAIRKSWIYVRVWGLYLSWKQENTEQKNGTFDEESSIQKVLDSLTAYAEDKLAYSPIIDFGYIERHYSRVDYPTCYFHAMTKYLGGAGLIVDKQLYTNAILYHALRLTVASQNLDKFTLQLQTKKEELELGNSTDIIATRQEIDEMEKLFAEWDMALKNKRIFVYPSEVKNLSLGEQYHFGMIQYELDLRRGNRICFTWSRLGFVGEHDNPDD